MSLPLLKGTYQIITIRSSAEARKSIKVKLSFCTFQHCKSS